MDLLDFGEPSDGMPPKVTMPHGPAFANRSAPVPTQPGIDLAANGPPSFDDLDFSGPDSGFGSDDDVDILTENNRPPSLTDSGTLEIAEEVRSESERRSAQLDSSSVDMNSRPGISSSEFDVEPASDRSSKGKSESDVDLALPPSEDDGSSSVIVRRATLDSDEEALAAQIQSRPVPRNDTAPNRRVRSPNRDEVPPARRRGYLLHGGVLGLLLGAGGVLAAYFGGALPDRTTHPASAKGPDNSGTFAQLRREVDAAKKNAEQSDASVAALKKSLADAGIAPDNPAGSVKQLAATRS